MFHLRQSIVALASWGLAHYWPGCYGSNYDVFGGANLQNSCSEPQFVSDFNPTNQTVPSRLSGKVFNFENCAVYPPSGNYGGDFTFAAWVNPQTLSNPVQNFIGWDLGTTNSLEIGLASDGTVRVFTIGNAINQVFSSTSIPVGKWSFLAVTLSAESVAIYIDGALDKQGNFPGSKSLIHTAIQLGGVGANSLSAAMAEIKLFGRALSAPEIGREMKNVYC